MNDKIDSNKKKDIQDFTHGPRIIVLDESDFDGSWAESEEGKRKLAELKEWLKDKELGGYSNPSMPPINSIYLPKKYLKWEDLEKDRIYKVLLNGNQYELVKRFDDYEYRCDYITLQKKPNVAIFIYEYEKEIFNDLHLEGAE